MGAICARRIPRVRWPLKGEKMKYYCYDCEEWFEYEDGYREERECPDCGGDLVDEDTYDEDQSIANDPYGDMGGPNGYKQDEEGNWYAL